MRVQIPMVASSLSLQNQHLPYSKRDCAWWPEPIADLCRTRWTPPLDRRHTVFGQLVDAESFAVLDAIAAVETGAMDKPVECIGKTIEARTKNENW